MKVINKFKREYAFLSNFYPSEFVFLIETRINGVIQQRMAKAATVEHAFQASKSLDQTEQDKILNASTPGNAKKLGRSIARRPDWETKKRGIMFNLLRMKFVQNKHLEEKLLATDDAILIEGNTWGDTFWGVCNGVGTNHLGETLMFIRKYYHGGE